VAIDTKVIVELHSFTTTVGVSPINLDPLTAVRHFPHHRYPPYTSTPSPLFPRSGEQARPQSCSRPVFGRKTESWGGREGDFKTGRKGDQARVVLAEDGRVVRRQRYARLAFGWTSEIMLMDADILITETGTSSFGLTNVALPSHSTYVAQVLWGAIGWSVGACLGAALAATEGPKRRTVLFVGDGSLQVVSTMSVR